VSVRRLPRDIFLGLAIAFVGIRLVGLAPWDQSVDAYAYWSTRDGTLYDASSVGVLGSYLYSPAFALLIAPVSWLPWAIFNAAWTTMNIGIVWTLAGRWSLLALLFLPIPMELVAGNVHLVYAAVAVFGLRYPALWVIPLITKVTPGIGLLWFVVRREWRNLAIALGATAALVAVSYLLAPGAWRDWATLLLGSDTAPTATPGFFIPVPLPVRLVAAAAIVVWGARTDRPWVLPIAMTLALPLLWLNGLATLAGLGPALIARFGRRGETRHAGGPDIRTTIPA
jgi:glycosyl transferase family 87